MVRRRRRVLAIGGSVAVLGLLVAGAVGATSRTSDKAALKPAERRSGKQGIEQKVESLLRQMTLTEKLQQLQLLSDGQVTNPDGTINPVPAQNGVGGVFSLTDPAKINALQHVAVEKSRLHIPDPVRVRHDPRLPNDLPDPARAPRAASTRRSRRPTTRSPHARRRRSASSRSTARWWTSRTIPAGAGSQRARARIRTSARSSRPRGSRRRRAPTTRRPTRSSRASSTSPPTGSPRAAASTTRPTCPSRACGTCTCRRSRLRSMRAPRP